MCFTTVYPIKTEHITPQNMRRVGAYTLTIYPSVEDIPLLGFSKTDFFLSQPFFRAFEKVPPKGISFLYLLIKKEDQICGLLYAQIMDFKAIESLNFTTNKNILRYWLADKVSFTTLVIGNLLLTGEHSYYFDSDFLNENDKKRLITEGVSFLKNYQTQVGKPIEAVFIKDFFEPQNALITEGGYNGFQVEPNFIMPLPRAWKTYDDYLASLSSKYRIRAKRAIKLLGAVEKKECNMERILAFKSDINAMYQSVCCKSTFNLVHLHPDYFEVMKRDLADIFRVFGYFEEGRLIGFFSTILNHKTLEAHYLGFDETLNGKRQIYLNMLFDMIKIGIESGAESIVFGRTAPEIKSSVGALAYNMHLYLRHEKRLFNALLPFTLPILSPKETWQPRHPLKVCDR